MKTAWIVTLALAACSELLSELPQPPLTPRATVVIEPPRIGVGDVAVVEVAVVTDPGQRVLPLAPPSELPRLWILDAERRPVEKHTSRWLHRTRFRVRAREAGRTVWPAQAVEIENSAGERWSLETKERPIEVVSVLADFPERITPFPLRPAPGPPASSVRSLLVGAALGALVALAGVGLIGWVKRERAQPSVPPPPRPGPSAPPPWTEALAQLTEAQAEVGPELRRAADLGALALRRYVTRRFGVAADVRTTEELEALRPPLALATRWATLVAILRALDGVRFEPEPQPGDDPSRSQRVRTALADTQRFVMETVPPELRA